MEKKMNSKLIKCTLPFPRVNASQQKHSTVNNFKHKYDFLNMEKQLDLGKICFLLKKKTILGILKTLTKIGIKQILKLKKLGN